MISTLKKFLRQNKYTEILAYILQNNNILNSSGSGEFGNTIEEMYSHNISLAELYAKNFDGDLQNKIVLELGTGFSRSAMLYLVKKFNIKKAYCYDRFKCLHKNDKEIIKSYGLSPYLEKIEYISGVNEHLLKIKLSSIDYVVSNAVLEHVYDLELLFSLLVKLLNDNAQMYHKVDLRCHNRFKKYGELYFHTFSEKFWKLMGSKIGQPNRKLLNDYHSLFDKLNLIYSTNIIEEFSDEELAKAARYLNNIDIKDYKASIIDFKILKNQYKG